MEYPQLIAWLAKARSTGLSDANIRSELLAAGWKSTTVDILLAPVAIVKPSMPPLRYAIHFIGGFVLGLVWSGPWLGTAAIVDGLFFTALAHINLTILNLIIVIVMFFIIPIVIAKNILRPSSRAAAMGLLIETFTFGLSSSSFLIAVSIMPHGI